MTRQVTRMMVVLTAIAFMVGCGGYTDIPVLEQQDRNSGCGGFAQSNSPLLTPEADYCAAEVLHWTHDDQTQTLKLADARVLLNCCGDHSFTVEEQNGVYVFTETDAPEGDWARCACMCVFDFTIEVTGITTGVIPIRIMREVTDRPDGAVLVFEADLDLTQGSGSIVIDETDVYPWCGEE